MAVNTLCFATLGAICTDSSTGGGGTIIFGDKIDVGIMEDCISTGISEEVLDASICEDRISISVNTTVLGIVIVEELL